MTNSIYPNGIDKNTTLPAKEDGVDILRSSDHNALRNAIINIEQELGATPSGEFNTVSNRLSYISDLFMDVKSVIDGQAVETKSGLRVLKSTPGSIVEGTCICDRR